MLDLYDGEHDGRRLRIAVTDRSDGDLHPLRVPRHELADRQLTLTGTNWAMADQVHGTARWDVTAADVLDAHPTADVVVVDDRATAVAVWAADCATLLLATADGRLVGAHAGWRGLADGVLDEAIDAATEDGRAIELVVSGPAIGPCCYEFGEHELRAVAAGVGTAPARLRASTRLGAPALDVAAAVAAGLARRGVRADVAATGCTGCSGSWWSHRVGVDAERHALVGWWM